MKWIKWKKKKYVPSSRTKRVVKAAKRKLAFGGAIRVPTGWMDMPTKPTKGFESVGKKERPFIPYKEIKKKLWNFKAPYMYA